MGKKLKLPIDKKLINFYIGDIETLQQFYSVAGYNMAVRELIHQHCNKLRERANREGATTNVGQAYDLDIDIDELAARAGAGGPDAGN